ncbi:hypothetical protein EV562_103278 [Streptomyces sp. BK208]|uniref:hypothetical protein n=1 Tax=Streptomyces sp. BK208 TaxID=2512150 RepID=UPI00105C69F6|nr:hypothetical protein [Streptomyces sp. BK208]TDT39907.1 hypothetical protein EV562_103278 [Streptomyces sp. BK208]
MRAERGRVAAVGWRGVVPVGAVVVLMLTTGCVWQQRTLARADIVGTWTGGDAGTLRFEDDGTVVATDLAEYDFDGDKVSGCSGTGEWSVHPDDGAAKRVSIDVCEGNPWEFGGSKDHPRMRRSVGDPDRGNFQTLGRE